MISQAYIIEWQHMAPWQSDTQIEQDLIISRIIVELFNDEFLRDHLLFRGGTALYKLFFDHPVRYSEDLDFVQITAGPIKPIVQQIQRIINPWLGKSRTQSRKNGFRIYYGFTPESDPAGIKRIKVEITTREHFSVFQNNEVDYSVQSHWFNGDTKVRTYDINELAGTKLRALYQRKKGRDLFDIAQIVTCMDIDPKKIIKAFTGYMNYGGNTVSKKQYLENLDEKIKDSIFLNDVNSYFNPEIKYDPLSAAEIDRKLIRIM